MIRAIYTNAIYQGELIRVTTWTDADVLTRSILKRILGIAVAEAPECADNCCSFEVVRVDHDDLPIFESFGDNIPFGDQILYGMAYKPAANTFLHYGRSPKPGRIAGLRYDLCIDRRMKSI